MAVDYNAVKWKNSYLLWKVNEQFCNSNFFFGLFLHSLYTHFVECKRSSLKVETMCALDGDGEIENVNGNGMGMGMRQALFYYQLVDSS